MAATSTALIASQPGASVLAAWPQVSPNGVASQNLDLIQIIGEGGNILLNVDHAGTVHRPASSPTQGAANQTRIGVYYSRLTSSATTAQLFADAFENLALLDILHVVNVGGNISYYLDYQGVAHGS